MTPDSQVPFRQAASVESVTDMSAFERALDPPTMHSYPDDPRYRRSGDLTTPQVGDIAYCGHVKFKPGNPANNKAPVTCAQCARLKLMAQGA